MAQRISSRDNVHVKLARRLATSAAARAEEGLFFAEGRRLCRDLAAVAPPKMAFCTDALLAAHPGLAGLCPEFYLVNQPVADKLSQTRAPQGLFCVFETPRPVWEDLALSRGVLLVEDVQDPANIGAMLRSAAAFGFGGVVLTPGCADAFAPKALRASAGAAVRLPVLRGVPVEQAAARLRGSGAALYAAALEGALPLGEAPAARPFVLMVGNEGAGLSARALGLADAAVCIPMQGGVESLNAAVAASVLMFHFSGLP